ncbi:hypothetical protein Ddc_13427 [Ditylenchus destructor]|nr:hypothetical protein Ddc_13427 [Ditylenchus destructor]
MQSDCELTHQSESLITRNESNERDEESNSKCDEPSPQLCHFDGIRGPDFKCSANGKLHNHYVPEGSGKESCKSCANWFMRRVKEHCKNGAGPGRELYHCDENCTTCKEYEQQFLGQKKTVPIGAYREFIKKGMQPSLVKQSADSRTPSAERRQKGAPPVIVENLPVDGSSKLSAGKEKFAEPQNNFEKVSEKRNSQIVGNISIGLLNHVGNN